MAPLSILVDTKMEEMVGSGSVLSAGVPKKGLVTGSVVKKKRQPLLEGSRD